MAGPSAKNLKKFIILDVHYPPHSIKLTGDKRRNKTENQVWLNIDHENLFSIIEAFFHYFLPIKAYPFTKAGSDFWIGDFSILNFILRL